MGATPPNLVSFYLRFSLRFGDFRGRITVGQFSVRRFSPLPTDRAAPFLSLLCILSEYRGQPEEGKKGTHGGKQYAEDGEVGDEGDQDQAEQYKGPVLVH